MLLAICALVGLATGAFIVFYMVAGVRGRSIERESRATSTLALAEQRMAEASELVVRATAQRTAAVDAATHLAAEQSAFLARKVSYEELRAENAMIKRDLRNSDVVNQKLQMDGAALRAAQRDLDERAKAIASRYLEDVEKWIAEKLSSSNFAACKQRLLRVVEWARSLGYEVSPTRESELLGKLKADFEEEVRRQFQREEQARIRAQIREEEKIARELERERVAAERERAALAAALDKAVAEAHGQQSEEIDRLRSRLAEAEAKVVQRTLSQAQITKAGHIYVISNIGSFGENVFKIGMTRRLEPLDRITELGDASVPFPFDVHMMISCTDAPSLENKLHRNFAGFRLNRVNPRKEFFKLDLAEVRRFVEENHGTVSFIADADASQYRQSISVSAEDQAVIEAAFDRAEAEAGAGMVED